MSEQYRYKHGTNVLAEAGKMHAFGDRILVRAILERDWYSGGLHLVSYSSVEAVAFEIISVGAGVARKLEEIGEAPLNVGDHVDVRSVAADRVNGADATGRYWLVPVADVAARIDFCDADDTGLLAALQKKTDAELATSNFIPTNGEVQLEAAG